MKKNFKVGLLYLKVNNLGDVVLHDTCKYLIDDYLKTKDVDYEIKSIDMGDKFIDTVNLSKRREKLIQFHEFSVKRDKQCELML